MVVVAAIMPLSVSAQVDDKGLLIAPLREEKSVSAGQSQDGRFFVGNYTDKPMDVKLTTKQFTAVGKDYHYAFNDTDKQWVRLSETTMKLQPQERREIAYTVVVPSDAPPGGQYFSLIASTNSDKDGGLPITLQAATLLYLTVAGNVRYESTLMDASIPAVTIDRKVPYVFDVENGGNSHFSGLFYAKTSEEMSSVERIILPETSRQFEGSVLLPQLPGFYEITYGYDGDHDMAASKKAIVLYLPPWVIIAIILIIVGVLWLLERRLRHRIVKAKKAAEPKTD